MSKHSFTGGDGLKGFQKLLHKVLLLNELSGRLDIAYQLSDAKLGSSGYSFGIHQLDLFRNANAITLFRAILEKNRLSAKEIDGYVKQFQKKQKFSHFNSNKDVEKINDALSSAEGIKLIDENYKKSIKEHEDYVDKVITIAHKSIKPYLFDPVVKLIIADVHNQYGTKNNRKLREFLEGKEVVFHKKVKLDVDSVKTSDDLVIQLRIAINAIANGPKSRADIARRQGNIDDIAATLPIYERVLPKGAPTNTSAEKQPLEETPPDSTATNKDAKPHHERPHQSGGDKHPSHHKQDSPRVHALKKHTSIKQEEHVNKSPADNPDHHNKKESYRAPL